MKEEAISALVDGELDEREAGSLIEALGRDAQALDTWRAYHLIGDALRDTRMLSPAFAPRMSQRLAAEATVLAPMRRIAAPRTWYAVAASVAAVALVGWLGFASQKPAVVPVAQAPELVRPVPQPVAKKAPVVVVPLPRETNDYLLAHEGFSPRVTLQGVAPYVRTVSQPGEELAK